MDLEQRPRRPSPTRVALVIAGLAALLACSAGGGRDAELAAAIEELRQTREELQAVTAELKAQAETMTTLNSAHLTSMSAAMDATAFMLEPEPERHDAMIPGADTAISCADELTCTAERAFVESLLADPSLMTRQARVMPSVREGQTLGLKIYGVRPRSVPKLLGIKNGDLLLRVNGRELKSWEAALELSKTLHGAERMVIDLERKGEALTKTVTFR